MPKHILLAMTVHHLTGSAEIITILNRFGHCQSYSRTLELETAMCRSVTDNSSHLPPSISTDNNVIVLLCWDNFDLMKKHPLVQEQPILRMVLLYKKLKIMLYSNLMSFHKLPSAMHAQYNLKYKSCPHVLLKLRLSLI